MSDPSQDESPIREFLWLVCQQKAQALQALEQDNADDALWGRVVSPATESTWFRVDAAIAHQE